MAEPRKAPRPKEWITGKALITYGDSYGADLPEYAKPILSAAMCLGGMQIHEHDDFTQEAAQCVICHARVLLDDAERLLSEALE